MWWPFRKRIEKRLITSFEMGVRSVQVSLYKNLTSQYSLTMDAESASVLAAQVVNYLKGEDVMAVMQNASEPLKSQIAKIRDQLPDCAVRAMMESGSTREVIVATLRMKEVLGFMLHGESHLHSDQHHRVYKLLSTYGPEFPDEEVTPSKYLAMAQQYHQETFGQR